MWYLIGIAAVVLIGFFVYAGVKKNKQEKESAKAKDESSFRTEESLNTYDKPMNDKHSHVDFDDAE